MLRRGLSSWASICLFLTPLLSFGDPGNGNDCTKHPTNPGCSVAMAEHWGTLETAGFVAFVLVILWILVRFRMLQPKASFPESSGER
jgi:hypothetical protein